jgi:kumamolisin
MSGEALPGSERAMPMASTLLGPADPNERFEVSVLIRTKNQDELKHRVEAQAVPNGPRAAPLSRAEYADRYGASASDLEAVNHFAAQHGLAVVAEHAERCTVVLAGTVRAFASAFEVELNRYQGPQGSFRGQIGPIHVPAELIGIVKDVLGLDNRPAARAILPTED